MMSDDAKSSFLPQAHGLVAPKLNAAVSSRARASAQFSFEVCVFPRAREDESCCGHVFRSQGSDASTASSDALAPTQVAQIEDRSDTRPVLVGPRVNRGVPFGTSHSRSCWELPADPKHRGVTRP